MPCPVAQPCIGHMRGSKGWRSGESARLPPMWPGSNPGVDAKSGLSLLLVLSLAARGCSLGTPVFPSPQKPTFPNSTGVAIFFNLLESRHIFWIDPRFHFDS